MLHHKPQLLHQSPPVAQTLQPQTLTLAQTPACTQTQAALGPLIWKPNLTEFLKTDPLGPQPSQQRSLFCIMAQALRSLQQPRQKQSQPQDLDQDWVMLPKRLYTCKMSSGTELHLVSPIWRCLRMIGSASCATKTPMGMSQLQQAPA